MSADPLHGIPLSPPRVATGAGPGTGSAAATSSSKAKDPAAAHRTAKALRDFQAVFLMEMLKPLTQELSGASGTDAEGEGLGLSSGADVYNYFWGEALSQHLAGALPALPGMEPADGKQASGASGLIGPGGLPRASSLPGSAGRPGLMELARALTSAVSADATLAQAAAPAAVVSNPAVAGAESAGLPGEISALAAKAGRLFSLPENLVRAVVSVESGGRTAAVSGKGAVGLMQLMPGTAKEMGVKDAHDAWDNLVGGAKYLARQVERFGRIDHALAAYNAGPGAVEKHGGIPPYPETRDYVRRVLAAKSRLDRTNPTGA